MSGSEPTALARESCEHPTDSHIDVDESSTYFLTGVLLCSLRLERGVEAPLITQSEIARRLTALGHPIDARGVRSHLDYLAKKLGLSGSNASDTGVRWWGRERLARVAITTGVIRPEHLALLMRRGA